ncbi:S-adenosyl-L-methionine-dependent methyltransferase [Mycena capillaripes]|nr:S-adenosyl-L-methionine-dependent methyltransferase [Mycena capillaripes]
MTAQYTHGHHESVLRSHSWRTAQNSCAYLLSSLAPNMHILDVGCGPGTITVDLANLVPEGHVTGIERSAEDVLQKARDEAAAQSVTNITYAIDDVLSLSFPDSSFDVVHAHQVLQHVPDPVLALREMMRVAKPGGIVAARDTDFSAMAWHPKSEGVSLWHKAHIQVARANGGEPDAGRRLLSYALEAGISKDQITATASTWCYSTREELDWWSSSTWGAQPDAWFALLHGEILCRKI